MVTVIRREKDKKRTTFLKFFLFYSSPIIALEIWVLFQQSQILAFSSLASSTSSFFLLSMRWTWWCWGFCGIVFAKAPSSPAKLLLKELRPFGSLTTIPMHLFFDFFIYYPIGFGLWVCVGKGESSIERLLELQCSYLNLDEEIMHPHEVLRLSR